MNGQSPTSRLHYLDAMRSVLMLLGVVLHSMRPYDSQAWQVKDTATSPLLDWFVAAIHLFRMPAFFVVAGYFAMFLVLRQPTVPFLRERLRRVLVPLLATLLTFNLVQVWLVFGNGRGAGFLQGTLLSAWNDGHWVSHLWFLGLLAVYFALVAVCAPALRRFAMSAKAVSWSSSRWILPLVLLALVVTPLTVAVLAKLVGPAMTDVVLGTASVAEALRFLPSFAIGMLLYAMPGLMQRFARCDVWVVALAMGGFIGMLLAAGRPEPMYRVIELLSTALARWMVVRTLFALFRTWINRPSAVSTYLSSASYSIYLFHHLVVVATATALMPLALGAGSKAAIVLAMASLAPLALHHVVVRRYAVFGYLFNGRLAPGGSVPIQDPHPVLRQCPEAFAQMEGERNRRTELNVQN